MSKIKILGLCFLLTLLVTGCGSEEKKQEKAYLYEGPVADETASGGAVSGEAVSAAALGDATEYETTVVKKGSFKEEFNNTADIEYTSTSTIYIDQEDAILDSIKVKKNQLVKKGDVLAYYHVETSKSKMSKMKIENEQARAEYEKGLSALQTDLNNAKKQLSYLTDSVAKKMQKLEIKKKQSEIEEYKKREKEVKANEKEYNKLLKMRSKTPLISKKTGKVVDVNRSVIDEELDASTEIITLRNNDKWKLRVADANNQLRYNMDVEIRLGRKLNDYDHILKGKVVTTTMLTGVEDLDSEGNNKVYIEVSKADRKKYNFEDYNIYIHAVSFEVKDTLLVDANAINEEAYEHYNKSYVYLLENGKLHKRFIVSNYHNDKVYAVSQGLEEGQVLALVY
ncbi:MAG: efflux RND transporter periplasmic adaptor subunit [Eubacterium sp.]|nr:efflux RND transporter periplasmic adaptor subunit [Eubacterium sp.]